MDGRERGFTLIEVIVAAGVLMLLLAAGAWRLSTRPNALAAASNDVDAAFAQARAIAASSGNGATIVFAPRTARGAAAAGFTVLLYSGRPDAVGAVTAANEMPVVADATVRERTLGRPPFALFVDSAGDASGEAAYPSLDSSGNLSFSVIAQEPACPSGGFSIVLANLQGTVSTTKSLPCRASLSAAAPANPSPTPNAPIVTPTALLYYWPGDEQRSFVATEWGYTHWFAASNGLRCGDGVAEFPDVLPSPYSAAYTAAEAAASPQPPADTPYSYPNSGGASMNDAPAAFPLQPQSPGLCTATVTDDFSQSAHASVAVMGWLTASYGGANVTHRSGGISIPAGALRTTASSVAIGVAKSYDSDALSPRMTFTGASASACANDVAISSTGVTTPPSRTATPATATISLTVTALPPSSLQCSAILYNHYSTPGAPSDTLSQQGEGIAVSFSLAPATGPLATLGRIVLWLPPGSGDCSYARLYLADGSLDENAPSASDAFNHTDGSGCVTNQTVALWASEQNYSGRFSVALGSCTPAMTASPSSWNAGSDTAVGPLQANPGCALDVESSDRNADDGQAASVAAAVDDCNGSTMTVATGTGCALALPAPGTSGSLDCSGGGSGGSQTTTTLAWSPPLPILGTYANGIWTRTTSGTQQVTWLTTTIACIFDGDRGSTHVVGSSHGAYTLN
ncbi:MAG: prepilin-type N-terminal cleavage/methylation domain-containing protein [Candidatus Tyrphobacter sp.]